MQSMFEHKVFIRSHHIHKNIRYINQTKFPQTKIRKRCKSKPYAVQAHAWRISAESTEFFRFGSSEHALHIERESSQRRYDVCSIIHREDSTQNTDIV